MSDPASLVDPAQDAAVGGLVERLEALAKAATPDNWQDEAPWGWVSYGNYPNQLKTPNPENRWVALFDNEDDAAFAKAANPATVLSLIEQIRSLTAERDALRKALEPFAAFVTPDPKWLADSDVVSMGSPLARKQLTAGQCRAARAALSSMKDGSDG